MQATYNDTEPRAVKVMFLFKEQGVSIEVGRGEFETVRRKQFVREVKTQRKLFKEGPWRTFQVLQVYGKAGIIPLTNDLLPEYDYYDEDDECKLYLGVFVMKALPFPVLGFNSVFMGESNPPWLVDALNRIPKVIHELHEIGYVHGDMHLENIAFDRDDFNVKPIVLDFGQCTLIDAMDPANSAMLRLLDYTLILSTFVEAMVRETNNGKPGNAQRLMDCYNIFVNAVHNIDEPGPRSCLADVPEAKREIFELVLSPIEDIQESSDRWEYVKSLPDASDSWPW